MLIYVINRIAIQISYIIKIYDKQLLINLYHFKILLFIFIYNSFFLFVYNKFLIGDYKI